MQLSKEILLTSSASYQSNQICVWDLVSFSPLLQLKDGAIAAADTLCPVHQEYIYVGIKGKPLLHRWSLSNGQKSKILSSQAVPGHISAMAISDDGVLLAAAIEEKLFLWQCNSGDLLAVLSGQSVKIIHQIMFYGSTFLISASQDGVITAWSISSISALYSSQSQPSVEPFFTVMPCTSPVRFALMDIVTDVLIIVTGQNGQVKVYSLHERRLLEDSRNSLNTDRPIWCVLASPVGQLLFFGSSNGVVLSTSLYQSHKYYLTIKEHHIIREENHPKNSDDTAGDVCCLAMTPSGQAVACGTRCGYVVLLTFPELLPFKKLKLDGPVTNLRVLWRPLWLDDFEKFVPKSCLVHPLKREIGLNAEAVVVCPVGHVRKWFRSDDDPRAFYTAMKRRAESGAKLAAAVSDEAAEEVFSLREEKEHLKAETLALRGVNRALHQQLIDAILRRGSVQAVNAHPESSISVVNFGKKRKRSESDASEAKMSSVAPVNGDASDSSVCEDTDEQAEVNVEEPLPSSSRETSSRRKVTKKDKSEEPPPKNKPKTARSLLKKNKKKGRRR